MIARRALPVGSGGRAVPAARSPDSFSDRGAVTVEAALGVGAVVAVFVLVLTAMNMVLGQVRCTDAAVEAARLASRGDREQADAAVRRLAPPGASLAISVRDDQVTTEVSAPPVVGFLPAQWWTSRAAAVLEPGAAGSGPAEPAR